MFNWQVNNADVLDERVLQNFRDLDEADHPGEFLNTLIDTFSESAPVLIESLILSIAESNEQQKKYYSHRLKGLCANLGALQLKKLFEIIEFEELASLEIKTLAKIINDEFYKAKKELTENWRL